MILIVFYRFDDPLIMMIASKFVYFHEQITKYVVCDQMDGDLASKSSNLLCLVEHTVEEQAKIRADWIGHLDKTVEQIDPVGLGVKGDLSSVLRIKH